MANPPTTVRLARILLLADSLLWIGFAVYTGLGAHPSFGPRSGYRWPAAVLGLVVAVLLGGCAIHLRTPTRLGYWLGVVLLAAMILASLLDQFGLADLLFVAATAFLLFLLVKDRGWYLHARTSSERPRGAV